MKENDVFDSMTSYYNMLSEANRRIADCLFRNKDRAVYMTISKLAEESGVSVATVTRFCRTLGYAGFHDFRVNMAKTCSAYPEGGVLAEDMQRSGPETDETDFESFRINLLRSHTDALRQTLDSLREEDLNAAVQILIKARRVFVTGRAGSAAAAKAAVSRFLSLSGKFICIENSYEETTYMALGGAHDAVLNFSYFGSVRDSLENLRSAREHDMKIVVVTHFRYSPAAELADAVLLCGGIEEPSKALEMNVRTSQMLLIDALYQKYREADSEAAGRQHRKIVKAYRRKLL